MNESEKLLFEEITPIGFDVSVTKSYWEYITTVKHPHIKGMESESKGGDCAPWQSTHDIMGPLLFSVLSMWVACAPYVE